MLTLGRPADMAVANQVRPEQDRRLTMSSLTLRYILVENAKGCEILKRGFSHPQRPWPA